MLSDEDGIAVIKIKLRENSTLTEIRNLSADNWNDFVSLMLTDTQYSNCWCLKLTHRKFHED